MLLNLAPGRVEGRGRSVPPDPGFPAVAARQEAGGGKALTAGPPVLEPQPGQLSYVKGRLELG